MLNRRDRQWIHCVPASRSVVFVSDTADSVSRELVEASLIDGRDMIVGRFIVFSPLVDFWVVECICTKSPLSHAVICVDGVNKQSIFTLLCISVVGNVLPVISGELRGYGYRSNLGSCQICINVLSTQNLAPVHWYLCSVARSDDQPLTHPYVMAHIVLVDFWALVPKQPVVWEATSFDDQHLQHSAIALCRDPTTRHLDG